MNASAPAAQAFTLDAPLQRGVTLLEASAGTGKTFSIAALCLRLVVEEGLPICELLVVTFTKAATGELRERVRDRFGSAARAFDAAIAGESIADATDGDPVLQHLLADVERRPAYRTRIEAALASFDTATISTMHGFCQRTLQNGAFETGADLEVDLSEDDSQLLSEIVQDFLHIALVDTDADGYTVAHRVAGLDEAKCLELAKAVAASPDATLAGASAEAELDANFHARRIALVAEIRASWPAQRDVLAKYLDSGNVKKSTFRVASVAKHLAALDEWLGASADSGDALVSDNDALNTALGSLTSARLLAALTKKGTPPPSELTVLDQFAALVELRQHYWGALANYVRRELQDRKQRAQVLSYDDLLQQMAIALDDERRRPAIQALVRSQFAAALIDEFQDTDRWQWSIFKSLFAVPTHFLYLIGDPKQSIYRFRGADVQTYLDARSTATRQFALQTNWRSDGPLLQALNGLYARAPQLASGIEYAPVEVAPANRQPALCPAPADPSAAALPALRVVHFPVLGTSKYPRPPARDLRDSLPAVVAADVCALLNSGATVGRGDAKRRIAPVDIAVLVDNRYQGADVAEQLNLRGVPAVRHSQGSVFDTPEARWLSVLLEAWLAPRRSNLARAVLLSPLRGLSLDEVDGLDESGFEVELGAGASLAQRWATGGIAQAWRAFSETHAIAHRLAGSDDGVRAWTNYQHLVELLHAEQTSQRLGPVGLTRWFAQQRVGQREGDAHQLRLDRDDAALTIVSVHGSKGLEYPVVFYPYASRGRSTRKPAFGAAKVFTAREGDDWVIDVPRHAAAPDPVRNERIEQGIKSVDEEQARKLYVALTRAKHQCHVYWGAGSSVEVMRAPFARLLLEPESHQELSKATSSSVSHRDQVDEAARVGLAQVSAALGPVFTHVPAASIDTQVRYEAPPTPRKQLSARAFTREAVDRTWRRASYSSLVHGASYSIVEGSPEAEGLDLHPRELEGASEMSMPPFDALPEAPPSAAAELLLAPFLRGADAGTFLHAFYEHVDFTRARDPEHIDEVLEAQMESHGIPSRWQESLHEGLVASLDTPLGGALGELRLAAVPRRDRIDELGFEFPVAGGYESQDPKAQVLGADFAAAVARTRKASPAFPQRVMQRWADMRWSSPARGFLTGSIDMLFRAPCADGVTRFFVVDYKSNWLGEADRVQSSAAHYAPAHLVDAMIGHDYHLQYHLYTLATHRYLRARMGERYDYERDFGGVLYLFVRGMAGPDTPRTMDGGTHGVFADRPEFACVQALDQLFALAGAKRRGAA